MIEDVIITPLKKIPDERGTIMHMLRSDAPHFQQFGEIYFSSAYPEVIKAWHIHKKMTLNYAVVSGMIKLVLYDQRPSSPTQGNIMEIFIGEQNYSLVTIPPGVANGYKVFGTTPAIVANCASHPHEAGEMDRLDPFTKGIPYKWDLIHK